MIGKSEWFMRRKYGGWGLTPKTWQGWAYVIAIGIIAASLMNFPGLSDSIRMPLTYAFLIIMCLDFMHLLATLKKDELEVKIEALSERNAAWAMILVIVVGVAYQSAQTAASGQTQIDWFLIAALIGGTLAKSITNLWLERKGV